MREEDADYQKAKRWKRFLQTHLVREGCVPLFEEEEGRISTISFSKDGRHVLKRSAEMENMMRELESPLIGEHKSSSVTHDGILYMILKGGGAILEPLYIGKAETLGKGDGNVSANISDLVSGDGKFGRWGYDYAYHLGDLSAAAVSGHAKKANPKYEMWRDALFDVEGDGFIPHFKILFWATLWDRGCESIWHEYGPTSLAFEENLLIGVAGEIFPETLLNRDGQAR